ncbi:MAG: glycosyl hydrolase family 17 protein, partial [Flavobacteriaceae bacterium]|nr:glycosyl hydrolase family 17 protein [Flavobacteriaceae bacterium]
ASGLQIDTSSEIDFNSKTDADIKALFSTHLNKGLHGLCFSPYLEGQNIGDQLSEPQISQRMDVIAPYTQWVRSFSCTKGNELTPKIAYDKDLKTMVGAWISDDKAQNEKEINALINLAKSGLVDIAVVGNETLMREELTENELLEYIHRVKQAIPAVPVTYVDAYYQFIERPQLIDACDVILVNCYPFWEGCSIDQSATYLKQMYAATQNAAKDKQVIISETGWPNQGKSTKAAQPSEINAMKYFINTTNWAQQNEVPIFYFSSFDESWKVHHEGDVGARWGLWDTNEDLKF